MVLVLLILFAPVSSRAASRGKRVAPIPREYAGPQQAVEGIVAQSGLAGVVLWPGAAVVDGDSLPCGTLAVAARALLEEVLGPYPEAGAVFHASHNSLALGAVLPEGRSDELLEILSRLALAESPRPAVVDEAIADARERAVARAGDPLEQARIAALGALFPGFRGPWLAEGTVVSLRSLGAAGVTEALALVRKLPVQARVIGARGLAGRVAERLGSRLGDLPALAAPAALEGEEPGVIVYEERGRTSSQSAVVLAARFDRRLAEEKGSAILLMLETLRAGEGSLSQRLGVAVGPAVEPWLEQLWLDQAGGAVVLGARIDLERVESAWSVLSGTISSLQRQSFRSDAVLRARQRLDHRAKELGMEIGSRLVLQGVEQPPWSWPPPDRWRAPIQSAALKGVATTLFSPGHRAGALAGPQDVRHAGRAFDTWDRIPAGAFCPGKGSLRCESRMVAALGRDGDLRPLAESVVRKLSTPGEEPPRQAFSATYRVFEDTPAGSFVADLEVDSGEAGAALRWRGPGWTLEARSSKDGGQVLLDGGAVTEAPSAALDRVEAYASQEPVVLAAAVAAGLIPARVQMVACPGADRCPAIRAELPEGSTLLLVLDASSAQPLETRIWWAAKDGDREPDEVLRYGDWREIDGTRIAGRLEVTARDAAPRRFELVRWRWFPAAGQ